MSAGPLALRIAVSTLRRPPRRHRYGSHARQVADLHAPRSGGPHPVAVVLHGGTWQPPYTRLVMRPLCLDLVGRGYAAWNVGYRRLGRDGGGWPMTFDDVAAGIDHLARLGGDADLDLDRVTLVGHSAGGQLALWAAGRARPAVGAGAVLALAPVTSLDRAGDSARRLLGGTSAQVPERYAEADPIRRLPLAVPVAIVHGRDDRTVPVRRSREYAQAARAAGADVTLVETEGIHRDPIDPVSVAWRAAAAWLQRRPA